jgi:hypothetical protein
MRIVKFCLKIISAGGKASHVLPAIETVFSLLDGALEEAYSSFAPASEPLLQLLKKDLDQEKVVERGMALQERLMCVIHIFTRLFQLTMRYSALSWDLGFYLNSTLRSIWPRHILSRQPRMGKRHPQDQTPRKPFRHWSLPFQLSGRRPPFHKFSITVFVTRNRKPSHQ